MFFNGPSRPVAHMSTQSPSCPCDRTTKRSKGLTADGRRRCPARSVDVDRCWARLVWCPLVLAPNSVQDLTRPHLSFSCLFPLFFSSLRLSDAARGDRSLAVRITLAMRASVCTAHLAMNYVPGLPGHGVSNRDYKGCPLTTP